MKTTDEAIDPPAAKLAVSAAQLPAVIELIERLRREASERREYQIEINITPIKIKNRTQQSHEEK